MFAKMLWTTSVFTGVSLGCVAGVWSQGCGRRGVVAGVSQWSRRDVAEVSQGWKRGRRGVAGASQGRRGARVSQGAGVSLINQKIKKIKKSKLFEWRSKNNQNIKKSKIFD